MDEEKKVEAVRDFYTDAEENKTTFDAAESILFYGKEWPKGEQMRVIWHCANEGGGVFSFTHSTLLKSFHKRRSCFLFTVCHNIIYAFLIKIFVRNYILS